MPEKVYQTAPQFCSPKKRFHGSQKIHRRSYVLLDGMKLKVLQNSRFFTEVVVALIAQRARLLFDEKNLHLS